MKPRPKSEQAEESSGQLCKRQRRYFCQRGNFTSRRLWFPVSKHDSSSLFVLFSWQERQERLEAWHRRQFGQRISWLEFGSQRLKISVTGASNMRLTALSVVVQAADDRSCSRTLWAEKPKHGRAAVSTESWERRTEGTTQQREEERARGTERWQLYL